MAVGGLGCGAHACCEKVLGATELVKLVIVHMCGAKSTRCPYRSIRKAPEKCPGAWNALGEQVFHP